MSEYDAKRRQLLQFLLYAPMGLAISCGRSEPAEVVYELGPKESLERLILLLGPWPAEQREMAQEFAARFSASPVAGGPYLQDSPRVVQSLAGRFPDRSMAIDDIDLATLPTDEREVLLNLAKQIYSFTETRFQMSGQPPAGECQGETTFHTLAPS